MEEKNKQVEREVEMEKILNVNQEDNVEVKESVFNRVGNGLDQNKTYYKNKGASMKLGGYGGLANASTKTRFTIIALLLIVAILTATTVYRHTHEFYNTRVTGYNDDIKGLYAGPMSVRFNSDIRTISNQININVVWYDQDGETEICNSTTYPYTPRVFVTTLSSTCFYDNWQTGDYTIEFSTDDKIIYIEEFEVVD